MSNHGDDDSGEDSTSKSCELKDIFKTIRDLNLEGQMVGRDTEQVGWGASCDVFRDKQMTSQGQIIQVAVKRIRLFLLDDISFARSLHREVRLWSKLDHPNVLPLRGYFLEGKKAIPNLVSEWMKRGTIIDYMKNRPFDSHEICNMVCGIASGLHYIHTEHSMIHADLKGSNILVSDDRRPLLADFGLSVSSSSPSLEATTFHGQNGSRRWMAKELHAAVPDELQGGPGHTKMTDMWAFGMVISELLTKKVPFDSIVESRVPMAILAGDLPREPDFRTFPNRFIFRGLWAIARQCWGDDPQCRLSAPEVLEELEPLMNGNKRGQNSYSNRSTSLTPVPADDHIICETDGLENMMGKLAIKDVTTRTVLQSRGARPLDVIRQNRDKGKNMKQPSLSKRRGLYRPRLNGAWGSPTPVIQPLSSGFILDPLQRPDVSVTEREKSPIIGLKFFNNWIKAVLIHRFAYPALQASSCEGPNEFGYGMGRTAGRVLDIGCGKGGDLQKWQKERAREYVGLDIAEVVVEQAKTRYFTSVASRQGPYMGATFACLDCFSNTLSQTLHPTVLDPLFDVASMQFCVQNAFESINKVKVMFDNVTRWLRKGGVFIGTMLNDQLLLSRLDRLPPNELSFGNAIHQVRFENREYRPEFGQRYWLYVQDAVKFIQEYVVYWETFVRMASEFNLELQYKSGFHEMYAEHCEKGDYRTLLHRMKVVDADGKSQMDEDQWETANLYIAFAFKKI